MYCEGGDSFQKESRYGEIFFWRRTDLIPSRTEGTGLDNTSRHREGFHVVEGFHY
jgi:hypothetical protein